MCFVHNKWYQMIGLILTIGIKGFSYGCYVSVGVCEMVNDEESTVISTQGASSSSIKKWEHSIGFGSRMQVKIKPYDEMINFRIWQRLMLGVLVQQRL